MKKRINNRIIIIGAFIIIVCIAVMLIPNSKNSDIGIVSDDIEFTSITPPEQEPIIKEEGAITIVLKRVPGAEINDIQSFSQEYIEGGWIYEGSVKVPRKKIVYKFQIDADLGNILQWEAADSKKK